MVRVCHVEGVPEALLDEGFVGLAAYGFDEVRGDGVHDVVVLIRCAEGFVEGEVAQVSGHGFGVVGMLCADTEIGFVVSRHAASVGEDVFDGHVLGCLRVLQDEVVGEELRDWSCPLDVWEVFVVDETGDGCRGRGFRSAG